MRRSAGVLAGVFLATVTASGQPGAVTPAAETTRSKLLKVQLSVNFNKMPIRDALKELAHLVEQNTERPIFWTYAPDGGLPNLPVMYNCKDKELDKILDELLRPQGLGFTVLSGDDHPRDGWVRVGPGKDRGGITRLGIVPDPTVSPEDAVEAQALARLTSAKALLEQGKTADAKLILGVVTTKFGKSKAAAEAKDLLEKLNK